jgi:hypothetical protein
MRLSGRRLAAAAAIVTGLTLALVPGAAAQGADQTCLLTLTKFDPATVNVAYPDDSAQYYTGAYQLVPGTRIRITGRYPHARYMSFNVYDLAQRPLDGISDVRIQPDPGSANPFLPGADRTHADQRSYTAFIDYGAPPANPAPNTLYTGAGQNGAPNTSGTFIYRIYIPDKGRDDTGGVGLPTVTVEPATATDAPATSPCADQSKPSVNGLNEALAQQELPDSPFPGGANPPTWRKFVNLASSLAINLVGSPNPAGLDLDTLGGSGGFLSNKDNAYLSAPINRGWGQVLVTRFRAPTFPDTRPPAATMPGGQLRYWSVCQNDPPTQRFVACLNDDRTIVSRDGWATFVVSTPSKRPRTATAACGVNWMPWGPNQRGVLIYRNMLPDPAFGQSVQRAAVDHEGATMGDYFPVSRYYADQAAYEKAVGCPGVGSAARSAAPATRRCSSRRRISIALSRWARRAKRAKVRISGLRTRTVRVRRGRVVVDLRRARNRSYTIKVLVGRRVARVQRVCPPARAR